MAKNHCLWPGSSVCKYDPATEGNPTVFLTLFESLLFFRCFKISDNSSVRFFEALNQKYTMYSFCTCRITGIFTNNAFCRSHFKYRKKIKKSPIIFQFSFIGLYKYNTACTLCVFITGGCCLCYLFNVVP